MEHFEYLSVMASVVLGLGVSHLIADATRLIQARRHVRVYWVSIVWAVNLFLVHLQVWWALFGWRSLAQWNYFSFLFVLLPPLVLYATAVLVLPEFDVRGGVDLRAYYYENHRLFFSLIALVMLLFVAQAVILRDLDLLNPSNCLRFAYALVSVLAAFTKAPWFHALIAPMILGSVLLFIVLFSMQAQ